MEYSNFHCQIFIFPSKQAVPLVLSIIIFVMQTIIHPYQDKIANFLESLILLWLVGLLSLGNATILPIPDGNGWPLLYLPVVCGFIVLVVYIVLQIRYVNQVSQIENCQYLIARLIESRLKNTF